MFFYSLVLFIVLFFDKFLKEKKIYKLILIATIIFKYSNLNLSKNNQEFLDNNNQMKEFNVITKN